jgi:hypothetical protein
MLASGFKPDKALYALRQSGFNIDDAEIMIVSCMEEDIFQQVGR